MPEEKIGKEGAWRHAALPKQRRPIEQVTPAYRWDTFNGREQKYRPDFLLRLQNGSTLAIEVKGEETQQDRVKRDAVREWVKAVNQHGGFGKWLPPAVAKTPDDIYEILANT